MQAFISYFNNLTPAQKQDFAQRCGTTVPYLRKVICTGAALGESLCINAERESGGKVRVEQMRDDVDWNYLRGTRKQRAKH